MESHAWGSISAFLINVIIVWPVPGNPATGYGYTGVAQLVEWRSPKP